jgi:hypothetical protein
MQLVAAYELYFYIGCVGFDNCWLFDNVDDKKAAFSLWSVNSGIKFVNKLRSFFTFIEADFSFRLDISTNQPALQVIMIDTQVPTHAQAC